MLPVNKTVQCQMVLQDIQGRTYGLIWSITMTFPFSDQCKPPPSGNDNQCPGLVSQN